MDDSILIKRKTIQYKAKNYFNLFDFSTINISRLLRSIAGFCLHMILRISFYNADFH